MSIACQKQPLNDGAHPYTTFGMASFAIGIILNVPARTKGLQSCKAISEPTGTHQRSRRLGSCFLGSHIADEAGPQARIGHPVARSLLGKALPTHQFPGRRHLHLAQLLVATDGAQIAMMGPVNEVPI